MRNIVIVALAAVLTTFAPSQAIFGIGFHGGIDGVSADAKTVTFDLNVIGGQEFVGAQIIRRATGRGVIFGGHFYIDFIPIIDIEVGVEGAAATYTVEFVPPPGLPITSTVEDDVPYGRFSIYLALKKDLWSPPIPVLSWFKFYAGAAPTMVGFVPLAGDAMSAEEIVRLMGTPDAPFTPEDFATTIKDKIETGFGLDVLGGVRFKIPFLPPQVGIEARYHIINDKTNGGGGSAFSIMGRFGLDF